MNIKYKMTKRANEARRNELSIMKQVNIDDTMKERSLIASKSFRYEIVKALLRVSQPEQFFHLLLCKRLQSPACNYKVSIVERTDAY